MVHACEAGHGPCIAVKFTCLLSTILPSCSGLVQISPYWPTTMGRFLLGLVRRLHARFLVTAAPCLPVVCIRQFGLSWNPVLLGVTDQGKQVPSYLLCVNSSADRPPLLRSLILCAVGARRRSVRDFITRL